MPHVVIIEDVTAIGREVCALTCCVCMCVVLACAIDMSEKMTDSVKSVLNRVIAVINIY